MKRKTINARQASDRSGGDAEAVDLIIADPGGVPFDDDMEDEPEGVTRGPTKAHDSPTTLAARGIEYPDRTPVGMTQLRHFVVSSRGGADLGILSKPPRTIRDGSAPSMHNWGMAWDWRFASPGPGRAGADALIEFLLAHADTLGIQAVHDYSACRLWKSYSGWRPGTPSAKTGMCQSWAQWLHIERMWDSANDPTSIESLVAGTATPDPTFVKPATDDVPVSSLVIGSRGADVARMQDFLQYFHFADFTRSDGTYGPRTQAAVMAAQKKFFELGTYSARVDGEWGPKTAAAASQYAH